VLIWGLIIGFVEASAFISLGFWRWAWDVTTWGLNHDWRGKFKNIECDLSCVRRTPSAAAAALLSQERNEQINRNTT
jgi:hypothetical protein